MSNGNKHDVAPAREETQSSTACADWKIRFHSHADSEVGKRHTESGRRGKFRNDSLQLLFWDTRAPKPDADHVPDVELARVLGIHPTASGRTAGNKITVGDLVVLQWVGLDLAQSSRVSTLDIQRVAVGDPKSPKPLHSACIWGKVVAMTKSELIVRFDAGGIPTEGRFPWSELDPKAKELQVGAQVIGRTELTLMLPEPDSDEEGEIERHVREEAAKANRQRPRTAGIKARIVTAEEQAQADAEWAARMAHLHSTPPPPPGDGKG